MVIILQLCIFLVFAIWRGRYLFGKHLTPISPASQTLSFRRGIGGVNTHRHIGISQLDGIPFIIRRERWYHRALKAIGIASEVSAGRPDFDKRFFITTDFPGHLGKLLASRDFQKHLQELFALPVKSLHATRDRIWCVIQPEDASRPIDHFGPHLEALRNISVASGISPADGSSKPASHKLGLAAAAVIAVHAGLLGLGLFGLLPTRADAIHTEYLPNLIVVGVVAGAVVAGTWFLLLLAVFLGSSWSSWVLADFILCGFLGIVLSGIVVVREANIHLPQPAATVHVLPIVKKVCVFKCSPARRGLNLQRHSYWFDTDRQCSPELRAAFLQSRQQSNSNCTLRPSFDYSIRVKHWRASVPYSFSPSAEVFDTLSTGNLLSVPVHPGALGFEWIDRDEIKAK